MYNSLANTPQNFCLLVVKISISFFFSYDSYCSHFFNVYGLFSSSTTIALRTTGCVEEKAGHGLCSCFTSYATKKQAHVL